jgi:hypothetical protein
MAAFSSATLNTRREGSKENSICSIRKGDPLDKKDLLDLDGPNRYSRKQLRLRHPY